VASDLQTRVLDFIQDRAGHDRFESLALEAYRFQYEHNPVYRAYCDRQPPVACWEDIPAVPTRAFKDFSIACFPLTEAVAEFHTSGTTAEKAGKHFFKTLDLYHAAIRPTFHAALLRPGEPRLPMLALTPSPDDAPHSSLSHMLGFVMREFGSADSDFFVRNGRLETDRLIRALCEAQWAHQPVLLLGTAFAFVHLLDHCAATHLRLELPEGSRVMETGGFKGRSREVPQAELYNLVERHLAVSWIVNEYGMTELSTQFYSRRHTRKTVPPWARVQIINPHHGKPAAPGEPGMIRVFDLANLWSSLCIQTEDLGVAHADGFDVLGRAADAEVRGCSLTAEAFR
jgi:hypothetical protein